MPRPRDLKSTLQAYVPPLVLGLLPFALFLSITLVNRVFLALDVQAYFFPYHVLPARMLAEGHLPLWNPYVFSGIPLLADGQTAMFYPPNWLFFVLPATMALNYSILLQFSIAGIGAYLFARELGLWRFPAFIAGLSYMFCGFLTARIVHLSIMSGAALIPLVLCCLDRLLTASGDRPHTRRWLAATGLAVAAQAVAGHPQIPVYTAVAALLLTIVRGVEQWQSSTRAWWPLARAPLLLASAYVLGYALAAIQLVPWSEVARLSVRAAGADYEFVFRSSTTGAEWLFFLFPYLLGAHGGSRFATGSWDVFLAVRTWEHSGYVGVLPLALALVGLGHLIELTRHKPPSAAPSADAGIDAPLLRHRWYSLLFLTLLLLIGLILAAGWNTPASKIVYRIPVLGSLRAVERGLVLGSLALTLLAGFGLQRIVERPQRHAWLLIPALFIVIIPAFFVGQARNADVLGRIGLEVHDFDKLSLSSANTYVPLLFALASGLLLVWWSRRSAGVVTQALAVALVLIDMGLYATAFTPTVDSSLFAYRPAVARLLHPNGELFRKVTVVLDAKDTAEPFSHDTLAMSWGMVHGVEDMNGFNSLQPRRYTDYVFGPRAGDVSYGYLFDQSLLQADSPILSSLNVRYLLVPATTLVRLGTNFREIWNDPRVHVYENTQVYPRAYFPEHVRIETDPHEVLRQVKTPGFDGRRDALVETNATLDLPTLNTNTSTPAHADAARVSPSELRVTTNTAERRLLVVSEMYFPGWHAYVDNIEAPILCTNYLFRGVIVPQGQHVVRFVYRPISVLIGAAISSLALICLGLLLYRG